MPEPNKNKGAKSQKAALIPQGEGQVPTQDNALDEVVSENMLYHPFENLMMTTGTLTPDRAAATTDIPSPSGDLAKPFSRSKRIDTQGGPTAWDQPDFEDTEIPKPESRKADTSINSTGEAGVAQAWPLDKGAILSGFSNSEVNQGGINDPKEGLAALAASVIGGRPGKDRTHNTETPSAKERTKRANRKSGS